MYKNERSELKIEFWCTFVQLRRKTILKSEGNFHKRHLTILAARVKSNRFFLLPVMHCDVDSDYLSKSCYCCVLTHFYMYFRSGSNLIKIMTVIFSYRASNQFIGQFSSSDRRTHCKTT